MPLYTSTPQQLKKESVSIVIENESLSPFGVHSGEMVDAIIIYELDPESLTAIECKGDIIWIGYPVPYDLSRCKLVYYDHSVIIDLADITMMARLDLGGPHQVR